MPKGFHPRRQGDVGEATAINWLTRIGACVAFPLFHSPDYDLIADLAGAMLRVQVKTSTYRPRTQNFAIQLSTSGGNQSWTGTVKTFDPARVDFLFALVADGRCWFIPSHEIEGRRAISLGGTKYSEFEIERAAPISRPDEGSSKLSVRRGGAGVGEPGQTVNLVAMPEWVRFPPPPPPVPAQADEPRQTQPAIGRTKLSSHHQVAVPRAVASACDLTPGDRFRVESAGTGRFVMTRIEEYAAEHAAELALTACEKDPAGAERRAPD
jgi:PD-(D/E)XK nuclease superfamily protein